MGVTPLDSLCGMITADPRLAEVFGRARRVAAADEPVLILGETGAGKEGVAAAIHRLSGRRAGPMEAVNCAVLSGDTASSELFGHERGAFTGADRLRQGVFERARGGTVFLDEIGELETAIQGRLLRLLETREVRRIGAERLLRCDFRLVAATHRNLAEEVVQRRFRRDLFYRVGVIVLVIPPLRERPDDVELLAERMLRDSAPGLRWSRAAIRALRERPWAGNVRELRNVVGRVAALAEGPLVGPEELDCPGTPLPPSLLPSPPVTSPGADGPPPWLRGGLTLAEIRQAAIEREVDMQEGNITRAASVLGVARSTVYAALGCRTAG